MSPGVVGTGEGIWIRRKLFHNTVGVVFLLSMHLFEWVKWFYLLVLGCGLILSYIMEKRPIRFIKWYLDRYDKIEDIVPGQGPITFFTGALFAWFIFGWEIAAISIIVLSFGDPLAYVMGKAIGGPKLPWSRRKTVVGSLFFMITPFLLITLVWNPLLGLIAATLGALGESIPFPNRLIMDDNVIIPVSVSIGVWAFSLFIPGLI
ncbi:MAG: diacylglycerol/polyprenol kinase family protein [Thermoplasmatota archaeon]